MRKFLGFKILGLLLLLFLGSCSDKIDTVNSAEVAVENPYLPVLPSWTANTIPLFQTRQNGRALPLVKKCGRHASLPNFSCTVCQMKN